MGLDAGQWPLKSSARIHGVTLSDNDDLFYQQSRVLYGESFPDVSCIGRLQKFTRPVVVAGVLGKASDLKQAFEFVKELVSKHEVKAVLCLASSQQPIDVDFDLDGWKVGSQAFSWGTFSSFEATTYVSIFFKTNTMDGRDLADRLAHRMADLRRVQALHGTLQMVLEPLITGPNLQDTDKLKKHQVMLREAVQQLKNNSIDGQVSFVDVGKRVGKVSQRMAAPSSNSCILALRSAEDYGKVSLMEALGYRNNAFNMSLLKPGTKRKMLAGTLPALLASVMLTCSMELVNE